MRIGTRVFGVVSSIRTTYSEIVGEALMTRAHRLPRSKHEEYRDGPVNGLDVRCVASEYYDEAVRPSSLICVRSEYSNKK